MATDNLTKKISLELSIGHLLVVWDVLSNRFSGSPSIDSLDEEEKRAVWALDDLCERVLEENGVGPNPEADWNELVEAAKVHVRSIPVDFLDLPAKLMSALEK